MNPEFYELQKSFFELFEERDPGERFEKARKWWHGHVHQVGFFYGTTGQAMSKLMKESSYWDHAHKVLHSKIADALREKNLSLYDSETDESGNHILRAYVWVLR